MLYNSHKIGCERVNVSYGTGSSGLIWIMGPINRLLSGYCLWYFYMLDVSIMCGSLLLDFLYCILMLMQWQGWFTGTLSPTVASHEEEKLNSYNISVVKLESACVRCWEGLAVVVISEFFLSVHMILCEI